MADYDWGYNDEFKDHTCDVCGTAPLGWPFQHDCKQNQLDELKRRVYQLEKRAYNVGTRKTTGTSAD